MSVAEELQGLINRQIAKRAIRGVLAAVQSTDGSVDASAVAGFADAAQTLPLTRETPYFLASITKMYTATVIMQLSRERAVELEAPIGSYLPPPLTAGLHVTDGTDRGPTITVEQLLFQTSGLADYFAGRQRGEQSLEEELLSGNDRALTIDDIVQRVRSLPPHFAPGANEGRKAHYVDTNYALLGAIIESVTGTAVATNFEQRIFIPLGLEHTFLFDHTQSQPTPAVMWNKDRALDIPKAMSSFPADGGMVATLADSLRFLRGFFAGELLSAHELASMTNRWNRIFYPMRYGAGIMQYRLPGWMSPFRNPGTLLGHSGSSGSFAFHHSRRGVFLAGTVNQSSSPSRPIRLMLRMLNLVG